MTDPRLLAAARRFGTPLYVYDAGMVVGRIRLLRDLFLGRFDISYAIKANPNLALMRAICPVLDSFDASSFAEVRRAVAAGMPAARLSFSGPAKRPAELAGALRLGVGEVVLESLAEAQEVSGLAVAAGRVQPCLVRLNPVRVPRRFGASMGGSASQFGIDEEDMAATLPRIAALPGLRLEGFHAYSGTNCLHAEAIAENFVIFADLFRTAADLTGIAARRLIFGSGMGIPYLPGEGPLDHAALPDLVLPVLDDLARHPGLANARPVLELGRWLVGPAGWLLTGVVAEKQSRGKAMRLCDAGFNTHLAACGMMGSVLRRNWVFQNLSNPDGPVATYTLAGPLCTSIDRLATDIDLPEVRRGDILAIPQSGAYGLTASPVRFISHPEPREVLMTGTEMQDVSESLLNHPTGEDAA
jgi:diaminopimelate decarboxylase